MSVKRQDLSLSHQVSHAQDTQGKERHSQKELIAMFSGFRYGYGLWFLLPVLLVLLLFGKFFWLVIPLLFSGFSFFPPSGFGKDGCPQDVMLTQLVSRLSLSRLRSLNH